MSSYKYKVKQYLVILQEFVVKYISCRVNWQVQNY